MGLWRFLKRRMAVKVFAAIGLLVGGTLLLQANRESRREVANMQQQAKDSADDIAGLFIGAVEHSMLQGEGLKVKALVEELKQRLRAQHRDNAQPEPEVAIYDQRGIEVFATDPPPPSRYELPPDVLGVLEENSRRMNSHGRVFRPVPNEARCHECHADDSLLRGVITIDFDRERCAESRREVLPKVITEGFTHVMTAERSQFLDDYFDELMNRASRVRGVAVFDSDADLRFGEDIDGLDPDQVEALLEPGSETVLMSYPGGELLTMVPLPMEDRCAACHSDPIGTVRGVLAVSLGPSETPGECASNELEAVIDTSLRFIMVSRLGRRIADFLDAVAATDAVRELVLYDQVGRLYWTTTHPEPPPHVAAVLTSGQGVVSVIEDDTGQRVRAVEPLMNDRACTRCHGSSSLLRGAVSVSLSTEFAARMSEEALTRRAWLTAFTVLAIMLVLGGLLHFLVVRPVYRIGVVAEEVGRGNLAVIVDHADENGDEIARLGQRINEMVHELQTKTHLEKFVSRGAAAAADAAGMREITRTGERRAVTVLFSDIRGFTAYAERVAPERVVEMLNRLLQAQADVVSNFGGDIDKFVGDELMALFQGANAEARAVLCATRMIDAVHRARRDGETLSVGIGISSGDAVYGAIGHENRMDFTVIGDVVNVGARLCSAAPADTIIVAESVCAGVGASDDMVFDAAEPLPVKGKREPLRVYRARRREPV